MPSVHPAKGLTIPQQIKRLFQEVRRLRQAFKRSGLGGFLTLEEALEIFPVKGFMAKIDGTAGATIQDSFNIASVSFQGSGVYRFNLTTSVIQGVTILDHVYPGSEVGIATSGDNAYSSHYVATQTAILPHWFEIQLTETFLVGMNLRVRTYDLQAGEFLYATGDINAGAP